MCRRLVQTVVFLSGLNAIQKKGKGFAWTTWITAGKWRHIFILLATYNFWLCLCVPSVLFTFWLVALFTCSDELSAAFLFQTELQVRWRDPVSSADVSRTKESLHTVWMWAESRSLQSLFEPFSRDALLKRSRRLFVKRSFRLKLRADAGDVYSASVLTVSSPPSLFLTCNMQPVASSGFQVAQKNKVSSTKFRFFLRNETSAFSNDFWHLHLLNDTRPKFWKMNPELIFRRLTLEPSCGDKLPFASM